MKQRQSATQGDIHDSLDQVTNSLYLSVFDVSLVVQFLRETALSTAYYHCLVQTLFFVFCLEIFSICSSTTNLGHLASY